MTRSLARSLLALLAALAELPGAGCSATEPEPRQDAWVSLRESGVTVEYMAVDSSIGPRLLQWAVDGRRAVEVFFGRAVEGPFTVRVYPDRATMEPEWRAVFEAPGMVFQCWMVANATASLVLVLAPRAWAAEACGHDGTDPVHIQRILAHEIVHVLHRNLNPDPRLSALYPSWWLVEGLATVASGQFDTGMRAEAVDALRASPPAQLERIWTSDAAYALSGSLVDYLDSTLGRALLVALMRTRDEPAILELIAQDEAALLERWRAHVLGR